jgi:hypothetical protein
VNLNPEHRNPDLGTAKPEPAFAFRGLALGAIAAAVLIIYFRAFSTFFFEDDFQLLVGSWNFEPANLIRLKARFKPVFET